VSEERLGERLQRLRGARGMTRDDLAAPAGPPVIGQRTTQKAHASWIVPCRRPQHHPARPVCRVGWDSQMRAPRLTDPA
jgi:hypothetical protein